MPGVWRIAANVALTSGLKSKDNPPPPPPRPLPEVRLPHRRLGGVYGVREGGEEGVELPLGQSDSR